MILLYSLIFMFSKSCFNNIPENFEVQVQVLCAHMDIFLCSPLQHHHQKNIEPCKDFCKFFHHHHKQGH